MEKNKLNEERKEEKRMKWMNEWMNIYDMIVNKNLISCKDWKCEYNLWSYLCTENVRQFERIHSSFPGGCTWYINLLMLSINDKWYIPAYLYINYLNHPPTTDKRSKFGSQRLWDFQINVKKNQNLFYLRLLFTNTLWKGMNPLISKAVG